jgi:hypothetical protein
VYFRFSLRYYRPHGLLPLAEGSRDPIPHCCMGLDEEWLDGWLNKQQELSKLVFVD